MQNITAKPVRCAMATVGDSPKTLPKCGHHGSKGFRYRRSSLCKAPRKRTFIANMIKTTSERPVVARFDKAAADVCTFNFASLEGGDGNNNSGNNNHNNGNGGFNDDDGANFGGNRPGVPSTLYCAAMAGALAMTMIKEVDIKLASLGAVVMALLLAPAPAHATHQVQELPTANELSTSPATGGYFAVHGFSAPRPSRRSGSATVSHIPYGKIELSEREVKILTQDNNQFRARECLTVS